MNYFDVLELSIDKIQGQDEATIQSDVTAAHKRLYALTVGAYANVPRPDGKTQAQWQVILNDARDTLLDPQKRQEHIAQIIPDPTPIPVPDPDPIKFSGGDEATSPKELAKLIDRHWEEAKTLLYSGFIGLWLDSIEEQKLAGTAKDITRRYGADQDIGLEELVQKLVPQLGKPKLQVNHSRIDFGKMDTESEKTIDLKITNVGRGFLYGNVQLPTDMPGLLVSDTVIRGESVISVKLDASRLTPDKTHQTTFVLNTNGGMVRVPVSCDVIPIKTIEEIPAFLRVKERLKTDKDDNTLLHTVAEVFRYNRAEMYNKAEVLLKNGAEVNAKNDSGNTPLHEAAYTNVRAIIAELLLGNGAEVNAKNDSGETPLHEAAKNNAREVAEILLKNGAKVNAKNDSGETPLHEAAKNNAREVAEILLKNGAEVNARDDKGRTPLRLASKKNNDEIAELLRSHGGKKGWLW